MLIHHLIRQLDIIPVSKLGQQISIIGAGAVGSFTALALAKMGFGNITVYDQDKIEAENMNCQFYPLKDIGKPKVVALSEMVYLFSGFQIEAILANYNGGPLKGIVISAVDRMDVRETIWKNQIENPSCQLVIDPRMGAETALLHVMNPKDAKDQASYVKTLYTDQEAQQDPCTAKSTIYTVLTLSGFVAKAVKDYVMEKPYTRIAQLGIADNQYLTWNK